MIAFDQLRLDDAQIVAIRDTADGLRVTYQDWQEKAHELLFLEVAGYQSFSPERRDLSHGTIEDENELIAEACRAADEDDSTGFRVFSFVAAWGDAVILRVIAKEVVTASVNQTAP